MRKEFFEALTQAAEKDKNIFFITADLGFGFVEKFASEFPNQFMNIGVSEQAMLGMSNGLAIGGKKVICYSIAAFSLLRPFEFFRNGAIAQNSAVMVVGVGPGFDYSQDGLSHYCLEDLAMVQSQPNLKVKTPLKSKEVYFSVIEFSQNPVPTYLRLPRSSLDFSIENLQEINEKSCDVFILTTTLMQERSKYIEKQLMGQSLTTKLSYISEISSEVDQILIKQLKTSKCIVVVEDHYEFGGLGTRVAMLMTQYSINSKLVIDAVVKLPTGSIGSFSFMTEKLMKNKNQVINEIISLVNDK